MTEAEALEKAREILHAMPFATVGAVITGLNRQAAESEAFTRVKMLATALREVVAAETERAAEQAIFVGRENSQHFSTGPTMKIAFKIAAAIRSGAAPEPDEEMVARVARAICQVGDCDDPNCVCPYTGPGKNEGKRALAAIKAMQE